MGDEQLNRAVGKALAAMRAANGYSQAYVARQLSSTPASVCRWENGTNAVNAPTLARLAALYEADPAVLLRQAINEARATLAGEETE